MAVYTLMHKDIPVAELDCLRHTLTINEITTIYDEAHLPCKQRRNNFSDDLQEWIDGRRIPASRQQLDAALDILRVRGFFDLVVESLGLSLTDHYWIRPCNSELTWKDVNFFTNEFSEDMGKVLFGEDIPEKEEINLMSPDNTSDGWLKKRWKVINGKRCLIKASTFPYQQEAYNEVWAYTLAEFLGINHTPYTIVTDNSQPYCICETFASKTLEFVSANRIMLNYGKFTGVLSYDMLCKSYEVLGIPNFKAELEKMLVLDYLIYNEDRHLNNFGVLRNSETLEWSGICPIFDSGTSMWYNRPIRSSWVAKCKPFANTHEKQIKLVIDFSWLPELQQFAIFEMFNKVYSQYGVISENRIRELWDGFRQRVGQLSSFL